MGAQSAYRISAFSFWLRTGLIPRSRSQDGVELKFNPWHDPVDGRFTSAIGFQTWGGGGFTGGGGGTFNGGGATGHGNWGDPKTKKVVPPSATTSASTVKGSINTASPVGKSKTVLRNGYEYALDGEGRTVEVTGDIEISDTQTRSRPAQSQAGGADRLPTDDGGHYIAARFDGPTDAFNHFAQDSNFNRGDYRVLEDQWARAKWNGSDVSVEIVPVYEGGSTRPSKINVWFKIDGNRQSREYTNSIKGKSSGKRGK